MIVLEQVSKAYDSERFAVREVSLRVPAGTMLVLLGGSGSGKTTTLKMINRLIEPTSGRIEVDGCDVRSVDAVQLRRGIGYVFQGIGLFPVRLLEFGSVLEVVPRSELRDAARAVAGTIAGKDPAVIRLAKRSLNGIDPVDVKRSYRFEQGFTFEINLSGQADQHRDAFLRSP